jgi:hypothetical protein
MRIWPTNRKLKRLALTLAFLVAIALIVNGVFAVRAEWQLRSRLAAIRAEGAPASIAELAPASVPDDQNAAAILEKIKPRLDAFSNEYGKFDNTPAGKKYEAATDRDEPPPKESIDAIREILGRYADVEQGINQAAACDKYASRWDFSVDHTAFIRQILEKGQESRTAARLLAWRSEVLLSNGQNEAAVKNGIQGLRLARLHTNEPTLVAYLITVAMRSIACDQLYDSLQAGPISPELHAALDEELDRHDDPNQLVEVLKTERGLSADWINAQFDGPSAALAHVFGWVMKSMEVGVLDGEAEILQFAALPWYEAKKHFTPDGQLIFGSDHGTLAKLLEPALLAAFQAHARGLAVLRALRIDNALRAFAERNGREATGLDELKLKPAAIVDPYSGQPLKIKNIKDGWIVYSVMQNGVDDGGDFMKLKDFGVAPLKLRRTEKAEGDAEGGKTEERKE